MTSQSASISLSENSSSLPFTVHSPSARAARASRFLPTRMCPTASASVRTTPKGRYRSRVATGRPPRFDFFRELDMLTALGRIASVEAGDTRPPHRAMSRGKFMVYRTLRARADRHYVTSPRRRPSLVTVTSEPKPPPPRGRTSPVSPPPKAPRMPAVLASALATRQNGKPPTRSGFLSFLGQSRPPWPARGVRQHVWSLEINFTI